jgi:biotin synthase
MLTFVIIRLTFSRNGVKAMSKWTNLARKVLEGELLEKKEALEILEAHNDEVLSIMNAAYTIRSHYFGNKVKLNMIINAKSGLCPENCGYCSQSIVSNAPIEKYPMLDKEIIIAGAQEAIKRQAGTYCIVASGRAPSKRDVEEVAGAVEEITKTTSLKICACLGFLNEEKAQRLQQAGVHRYNHNLNTHRDNHPSIVSTHTYKDRVNTVNEVKKSGISPCSGCIFGMGETNEQIYEIAISLRDLDVDSIPVNFLHAIKGTPLQDQKPLEPLACLKILALMRFINPSKEIRISGGREVNLRSLQPLGLYAANSIFVGDYLTTDGQEAEYDHKMIEDLGFEIEGCAL